jgi:putative aldouronate transport system substrate-binding protein
MKPTKLLSLILAVVMVLSLFAGCSSGKPAEDNKTPDASGSSNNETIKNDDKAADEIVDLNFYISAPPSNDQERIMEKANAIIEKEIGAHLNLIFIDPGMYAEKINLMISSGEEFDLCFMANWGDMNFFENAAKGAFVDMTGLLAQYAPQTYSRIPEALWDGVKVDGKIYGSVNYQQWGVASRKGVAVRMDIAEEAGFDWKELKGKSALDMMEALTPFLEKAVAAHPEMIGWETSSTYSFFLNDPLYWDMEPVGDMTQPGWVRFTEADTVINQFETPEFAAYCDIMREWYQKGLVRKDGATLQDPSPDRQANRILAGWNYDWPDYIDNPPTGVAELTIQGYKDANYTIPGMSMTLPGEAPAGRVSTTRTVVPAAAAPTACVAISATSKHPEKAMEMIELLNTNDELFNLIQWGEEGVDFQYNENGDFTRIDGMYSLNYNEWQIGQSYNPDFTRSEFGRNQTGDDQKKALEIVYKADLEADPSPVTGFTFDATPVKTELANCSAVISEFIPVLSNGAGDPAELLPQFLSRLENAGVNTIIVEKQAQLDAWKAANN